MDALILENVRCFAGRHEAPIAPLTLLVGENSTGKTTFLATAQIALQLGHFFETPDFNQEPFLLGAFEQIMTRGAGSRTGHETFSIGFTAEVVDKGGPVRIAVDARFGKERSQPIIQRWVFEGAGHRVVVTRTLKSELAVKVELPSGGRLKLTPREPLFSPHQLVGVLSWIPRFRSDRDGVPSFVPAFEGDIPTDADVDSLNDLLGSLRPTFVHAFAPVRSEPRRTYELITDTSHPQGSHVPMILANLYGGKEWQRLKSALEDFGAISGLFDRVEIKHLGKEESSPFQILVRIAGPAFNLVDVGYGVSQALPIVVDLVREPDTGKLGRFWPGDAMFLLQQPEVHLHPRAQAALGTLLGTLVRTQGKRFLVETHSDYLVDRVRMDVRDKKTLKPEEVVILFFERAKKGVVIHPIRLDDQGNLIDPPASYRRFFLDEERRFLGV